MSLINGKITLINELLEIFTMEAQATDNPGVSRQRMAEKLANAIDKFVRSGEVKVTVSTTGTAAAQTGTGTGNIT